MGSIAVCCSVLLLGDAMGEKRRWAVLQCVVVCCSKLQYLAVCCSVLQCVAVCGSVWQCVEHDRMSSSALKSHKLSKFMYRTVAPNELVYFENF